MSKYEPVIGLEIHVQLKTKSKMFCSSPNDPFLVAPNTNICEVCTGQPGSLPVANKEAIEKAVKVGLALGCQVREYSKFDRKNYFYPDLPKAYQISQYDKPIAEKGEFKFIVEGEEKTIRITRAHLEEDTGKLIHEGNVSLVDYNRAGVPLLEIVTEPDFRSAREVKEFLEQLRNIVRYLDVSDGDMEKGNLRGEPNISVRIKGEPNLPDFKVELKNLNSFRAVYDSVEFEIARQSRELEAGNRIKNETRGWDGAQTVVQRSKEEAHDYRYFPEPDLPVLNFPREYVEELRAGLPELPNKKEKRFMSEFQLSEKDAEVLVADKNLAYFFEKVVSELQNWFHEEGLPADDLAKFARLASNWITVELQALLKQAGATPQESKVSAENLAELIKMIDQGEISSTAGKQVLLDMFESGGDPSNIVQDKGLGQVSDEVEIAVAVDEVIKENPAAVSDWQGGKEQVIGFLVGLVMGRMKGRANPQVVNKIFREKLK
jgi:aspartyl-tRNA(Asn)/glutamyl-tRNA(Gln) amidotransferase subunit B